MTIIDIDIELGETNYHSIEARSALAQNGRDLSFGSEKSRLLETFFLI